MTSNEAMARAKRISDYNALKLKAYHEGRPQVAPTISPLANGGKTSNQNNNVNQTFNFNNADIDHKQVGNETQVAITKAFFKFHRGGINGRSIHSQYLNNFNYSTF